MTTDIETLEVNIRNLERENRELRTTLRDTFASAALTGLVAARPSTKTKVFDIAVAAYVFAEAMLEARSGWQKECASLPRLEAVKRCRELTGMSLKDAVSAVDELQGSAK